MERQTTLTLLRRKALYGALLLMPLVSVGQAPDSRAINELLKETESHVTQANDDAELLESYARANRVSWQSHATRLAAIKEHANDLIEDFNTLNSMKQQGSSWQQEAIERVTPLLQEMSKHLSATINHFNDNKSAIQMPAYRDYAKANREYMTRTSQLISDFVKYGETRAKADALEATLELDASAQLPKN